MITTFTIDGRRDSYGSWHSEYTDFRIEGRLGTYSIYEHIEVQSGIRYANAFRGASIISNPPQPAFTGETLEHGEIIRVNDRLYRVELGRDQRVSDMDDRIELMPIGLTETWDFAKVAFGIVDQKRHFGAGTLDLLAEGGERMYRCSHMAISDLDKARIIAEAQALEAARAEARSFTTGR